MKEYLCRENLSHTVYVSDTQTPALLYKHLCTEYSFVFIRLLPLYYYYHCAIIIIVLLLHYNIITIVLAGKKVFFMTSHSINATNNSYRDITIINRFYPIGSKINAHFIWYLSVISTMVWFIRYKSICLQLFWLNLP